MGKDTARSTIGIYVDDNGVFTYDFDGGEGHKVHVFKRQNLSWTCGDGNFSVVFKNDSPFPEPGYAGNPNRPVSATVKGATHLGSYPYSVMVVKNGKTFVSDPEILVDDGPIIKSPRVKNASKKKSAAPAKGKATKKSRKG